MEDWRRGAKGIRGTLQRKNYVRRIKVDEKGRFSFKVYGTFEYAVEAEVFGQRDGRSPRIQLRENSTNLKLELTPQ
jgi:hypothetical protein